MEEILALKLDADWVVLSACNTGAGAGAGAEAASGLGRAFFYAGTRALLVTNWSVHSQSARELVTDLFRRQADDPKIVARRSAAAGDDGADRRPGLHRQRRARPCSPMPIRCSGRPTPSSAMAACDETVEKDWNDDETDFLAWTCGGKSFGGRFPVFRAVAGDTIDHGGRGQIAAAEGRDCGRPARYPARSQGGVCVTGDSVASPHAAPIEVRVLFGEPRSIRIRSR